VASDAKLFEYSVALDADGTGHSGEGGSSLPLEEEWSPEHLVLAGLARCTLKALEYHARRTEVTSSGSASASGEVTQRTTDGRYAFVHVKVELDVTLEPAPQNARELLAKAERDCFVGASLAVKPRYRWTVNGEEVR
jgi:organic hydroperoxide reductase OsmC/OhrA